MKECGETDGVPQVTMHLQTFSYIFQNNILCKSDIYYGHDGLFIILVLVHYIVNVMLLFINHVVHQRLLKIWCHLQKCFINYYISWYCIFLFTNSIVNNTGIIFYTSIVNNTGIPVLWSPSTGDPYVLQIILTLFERNTLLPW